VLPAAYAQVSVCCGFGCVNAMLRGFEGLEL
jgi:hypothetical protein